MIIKAASILFFLAIILFPQENKSTFKSQQLNYARVKQAYKTHGTSAVSVFDNGGTNIYLRAFKLEQTLELWINNGENSKYTLAKEYDFCALSGELGPKRMQGDMQVPEGFYHIDRFNPYSNFHLSLGINYPNQSDRIMGRKGSLGGDIFIHGSCVTVGCIPITDEKIKELYIIAVEAKSRGQGKIPVHVFPFKMTEANLNQHKSRTNMLIFWQNIKEGYTYFETNKTLPKVTVNTKGAYLFQ